MAVVAAVAAAGDNDTVGAIRATGTGERVAGVLEGSVCTAGIGEERAGVPRRGGRTARGSLERRPVGWLMGGNVSVDVGWKEGGVAGGLTVGWLVSVWVPSFSVASRMKSSRDMSSETADPDGSVQSEAAEPGQDSEHAPVG